MALEGETGFGWGLSCLLLGWGHAGPGRRDRCAGRFMIVGGFGALDATNPPTIMRDSGEYLKDAFVYLR
ncbi:hypothetical protein D5S17_20800 [Pseudonocardiaceae bacterium YIM PH 21723]|nr:hypothetical protein D5S17_20800 [Pseudonocardiaceae bacterium YIM PH 21723]